jgi:hypothetical protein
MLERRGGEVNGKNFFQAFPQAASPMFEEKFREALRERRGLSFEAQFQAEPLRGWFVVHVYPHANGISVFFQRRGEPGVLRRVTGSEVNEEKPEQV